MTYPRVIQFETRELEIEARARLARERRAARASKPAGDGWRRLMGWRPAGGRRAHGLTDVRRASSATTARS